MKQSRFYPMPFSLLILAGPLLATAQSNISVNGVDNTAAARLSASTARRLPAREGERESYTRIWPSLFGEESRDQPIRLAPDTLWPNALVLRRVEREEIEEYLAIGNNGPALAHFIINSDRNPRRLGKTYPYSPHLEGKFFSGKVLDLAPTQVALSSVYLEEQAIFDPGIARNHAWSLGADTQLFSGHVHFYGEYAWSRERQRLPEAMPVQDGDAYKLQLDYKPSNVTLWAFPLDWAMGIKHQRMGPFFRSPAAPDARRDVSLVEAFTHLGWRGITLGTALIQERSNFSGPRLGMLPQEQRVFQLSGGYRFLNLGLPSWLGVPSVNMLFSRRNREAFEQGTSSAKLEAAFAHRKWFWNLSQTLNWHEGEADMHVGYSRVTAMETQLRLLDNRLSLAPVFQYRHYVVEPSANEQWLAGVDTCAVFIPERLKGQFRTDVKRILNRAGIQHIYSTRGDLNWQLTRRKAQGLAARLFLEGRYEVILNQKDNTTALVEDYLVLIGITFD